MKERCSNWAIFGMVVLGALQFCGGAMLLYAGIGPLFGMALLAEGISDILYGVFSGITGYA